MSPCPFPRTLSGATTPGQSGGGSVLPLYRDAISVFYSPSQLGLQHSVNKHTKYLDRQKIFLKIGIYVGVYMKVHNSL